MDIIENDFSFFSFPRSCVGTQRDAENWEEIDADKQFIMKQRWFFDN